MRLTRVIAKAWGAVCLYAGAAALCLGGANSTDPWRDAGMIGICVALFLAMGFVFIGGAIFLSGHAERLKGGLWQGHEHWFSFDDAVFAVFAVLGFADQFFFAPLHLDGIVTMAVERAAFFAVPGQRAFVLTARMCMFDGGRIFASAFSWCLAIVYLGSALSRLKTRAWELKLLRVARPDLVGGWAEAVVLGLVSVVGIQLLYVGSGYAFLSCSILTGISGALVVGLAPLMLAYCVQAALTLAATRG